MSRYCLVIVFAIALGLCTPSPGFAQTPRPFAVVTGLVVDSSTAEPIGGAIAFLARNGIGTSTGPDGRFVLPRVPPGEYDLVLSRVGYRRAVIRIAPGGSDTVALNVRLVAAPPEVGGVEVSAEAGGPPPAAPIFLPDGGKSSWCAYGSETETPVGILYTEKLLFFYHLDMVRMDGEDFARFWLLIFNGSEDSVEFNAATDIRTDIALGDRSYPDVKPDRSLPGTAAMEPLTPRNMPVERTLSVLASQSRLFVDEAHKVDISPKGTMPGAPFLGWLNPQDHPHGVNPRHLFDVYNRCTHDGTLKSYRLPPGGGVDGRLLYPMPGFRASGGNTTGRPPAPMRFDVRLSTPTGEERIVFTMH